MLTTDLLRVRLERAKAKGSSAKRGPKPPAQIVPEYLDVEAPEALERARELLSAFERHYSGDAPNTRGALDETIGDIVGHGTDFLIWRGLAKLLLDRSEFEVVSAVEPLEIRRAVFEASQALGPVIDQSARRQVLEQAAAALKLSPAEVEQHLYADLDARKRLTSFKPLEPQALLQRYNLALAQAVLYRATRLVVEIEAPDSNQLRHLFQVLKFRRLMHRFTRSESGYRLEVDGPASLFSKSRKYGLQMAMFLPAIFICESWSLRAELDWRGLKKSEDAEFRLSDQDGLSWERRAAGQWIAEEERYFEAQFKEADTPWQLERQGSIVELADNQVIIPDYRLTHPDGREVLVEIVGFWRLGYLERRIELLSDPSVKPFVLVVSDRLKTGREKLADSPAHLVFFKGVILVNKVIDAAEAVAPMTS